MTCERARELMIEALYGELGPQDAHDFNLHVSACTACASVFEEMRATGAAMRERRRPDPGDEYWNDYYARLEARIERDAAVVDGAPIAARRRSYVSWGYRVAAAVAVLAAGVWIGRSTMNRSVPNQPGIDVAHQTPPGSIPADSLPFKYLDGVHREHNAIDGTTNAGEHTGGRNVQLASADVRARDYIERSQVLLLELINSNPDTTRAGEGDYHAQQARAGALVREASVLRDDLPGSDNRRMRDLVTELQLVLREIANLESKNDYQAVEIIRNRVSREGVLMKIDVEQMRDDNSAPKTPAKTAPKRGGAIDG